MNKLFKFLIVFVLVVALFGFGMNAFASVHSKWSAGDLVFYDGATDIFSIRSGTSGVKIFDDINLTFGTDNDATIVYDETTDNKLEFTCSNGFTFTGALGITGILTLDGSLADALVISGVNTDAIEISGNNTYGINISASQTAAFYYVTNQTVSEGAWVHGLKIETTRTTDAEIASGGYYGAQIVVNKGAYATRMAPNTYGLQVVIKGSSSVGGCYGLAVETQSSGEVDYLSRFLLNTGTTLAPAGAIMYFQSYVDANIGLKIGQMANATTMTSGIYFEDNVGTGGTITSLIQSGCRNDTYLLNFDHINAGSIFTDASVLPGNATYKIKCRVGTTTFYLIGVANF